MEAVLYCRKRCVKLGNTTRKITQLAKFSLDMKPGRNRTSMAAVIFLEPISSCTQLREEAATAALDGLLRL